MGDLRAVLAEVKHGRSEAAALAGYRDGAGRSALHFAANFGQVGVLQHIVKAAPA